jgi:protease I
MATVALLLDRSFEDRALQRTLDRLAADGHEVRMVGPRAGQQLHGQEGTTHVLVEHGVDDVDARSCDALLVPLGVPLNHLRTHERMLNFARDIYALGRPVAVHHSGGWALVRADARSRGLVSWPSVKRQLFVDGPASIDDALPRDLLITSREAAVDPMLDAFLAQLERGPRGEVPTPVEPGVDTHSAV